MRLFISGSAPLLADTHREWAARTGHAMLERYGMTETNMNTSNPYDGERVAGAVGLPLPGVAVRVTDPETGKALEPEANRHDRGEGPERIQGLLADAGKDQGRIPRRRLLHHRRPRQDRRTRAMSTFVGRGKDLVISGGLNVYPKEIESEIDAMPGVVESAVIGVPHADFGEGVDRGRGAREGRRR